MLHLLDNLPKPLAGFGAAPQAGLGGSPTSPNTHSRKPFPAKPHFAVVAKGGLRGEYAGRLRAPRKRGALQGSFSLLIFHLFLLRTGFKQRWRGRKRRLRRLFDLRL